MTRPFDVIGIGANSVDEVHVLPHHPQPEGPRSKMRIRDRRVCCGGQTATAVAACVALGLSAKYVGAVGSDERGRRVRRELGRCGVDVAGLLEREATNQYALILIDESSGERIVLWDRDERLAMRDDEVPVEAIRRARVVHVDDVDQGAAIAAATAARHAGVTVTSDIDQAGGRVEALIATVTYPIFAEHVPAQLTGESDVAAALRQLRRVSSQTLVVTLGARGAVALEGERLVHSPGFAIDALDTTGAGDVFRGAFIYAVLRHWPIEEGLRFANAAAAVSCTRLGAMASVPSLADVQALSGSCPPA